MPQYIELDKLLAYPIRRNHCDKKRANPHFLNGIESVFEYIATLPVLTVLPAESVEQIKWERDTAIKQLESHGIPFCGE